MIKRTLNVSVIHNDNFFRYGLLEALKDKFSLHSLNVSECMYPDLSDIAFYFVKGRQQSRFCVKSRRNPFQLNFTIRNGIYQRYRITECCISEAGVVYTNQPVKLTIDNIYNEWQWKSHYYNKKGRCYLCDECAITKRERCILSFMAKKMTQSQIADVLNLSVKTVNAHKITAMSKLGFKRNVDLYHWLMGDWDCNV